MRSWSDSNMNRLRRSDECLRTSQHTDVLRCLFEEKGRLAAARRCSVRVVGVAPWCSTTQRTYNAAQCRRRRPRTAREAGAGIHRDAGYHPTPERKTIRRGKM